MANRRRHTRASRLGDQSHLPLGALRMALPGFARRLGLRRRSHQEYVRKDGVAVPRRGRPGGGLFRDVPVAPRPIS